MEWHELLALSVIVQALHDLACPDPVTRLACVADIKAGGLDPWVATIVSEKNVARVKRKLSACATAARRKPLRSLALIPFPLDRFDHLQETSC